MALESCAWCGVGVEPDDGLRLVEPDAARHAAFCTTGHLRRWVVAFAPWTPGTGLAFGDRGEGLGSCTACGAALDEHRLLLVRHRGALRLADAFCGVRHLRDWARASDGRWRAGA